MTLKDLELQTSYRSGTDNLLDDFYVPCLQECVTYDRAVGYFSSALFQVVGIAFSDFAQRAGRMRLICSPAISAEDFATMKEADRARLAQESVDDDLNVLLANDASKPATRLLATLIRHEILEVRIAFSRNPAGIFHDKLGIFGDTDGRRISFVGSANETWRAWGMNHESFEVFRSWRDESELLRTRDHTDAFNNLWAGFDSEVDVVRLGAVTADRLIALGHDNIEGAIDGVRSGLRPLGDPQASERKQLLEHQRLALEDWNSKKHRGIINFATGAGKTITAIEAARSWVEDGGCAVILVPGRDLHIQWIREIESQWHEVSILPAGGGFLKSEWQAMLPLFTTPSDERRPRIVVCTNKTFASDDFQQRLRQGSRLLIVADEMHRVGSPKVLAALENVHTGASLGLSATYARQFDEQGTAKLIEFFGSVLNPQIGLAEALMFGLLVPYDYRLHEVQLVDSELDNYRKLTERIRQLVAKGDSPSDKDSPLQMLLIKRARLLKQAVLKAPLAIAILLKYYQRGDRWLVYCDDISQLTLVVQGCLDHDLPVLEFYAEMPGDRDAVLASLGQHGGIVVAIRCLDEGIDIPATDHALILASSTVEREYIQRRGRVLRRAPQLGKVSAEVHDLILVDEIGGALTRSEATRALEFARLARNPGAIERLKNIVALSADPIELPDDVEEEWTDERQN